MLGIILIVLLVVGVVASNVLRRNSIVKGLKVMITYGTYTAVPKSNTEEALDVDLSRSVDTLVTAATLGQEMLDQDHAILSVKVKDVDADHIESLAKANPYVENAEVSVSIRGDIVVRVVQRTPVVRMFVGDEEYYLSHDGKRMPLSLEGEADVLVGNACTQQEFGNDTATTSTPLSKDLTTLWKMACYLYDNPLYGALFDQECINAKGDLVLVPKVGNHVIVIGDLDDLDSKMADLLAFYRKGLPQVGWNTYQQISLKYKGQIICKQRKRELQ